MYTLIG